MKWFKLMLSAVVVSLSTLTLKAVAAPTDIAGTMESPDERDIQALKEFIKTKRAITVEEKGGDLVLSGEVAAKWVHKNLSLQDPTSGKMVKQYGSGSSAQENPVDNNDPAPSNQYVVRANIYMDYNTDKTWASMALEFENQAGTATDQTDQISLQRAKVGYNLVRNGISRIDIELGRDKMSDVYDSYVMFDNIFDAVTLGYWTTYDNVFDFYAKGGPFVVGQQANQIAWVTELGLMDIANTGTYVKYDYVTWLKRGISYRSQQFNNNTVDTQGNIQPLADDPYYQYRISQLQVGYFFDPEVFDLQLFAAVLKNHAARRSTATNNTKADMAWYAGFLYGSVDRKGDWSIGADYQYVQALAIPEFDVSGIGRGNPKKNTLFNNSARTAATAKQAQGNTNYRGFEVNGLYALTDNLTLMAEYQISKQANANIGGKSNYHRFQMGSSFAF